MAENPDSPSDFPLGELREITLLLPGEHFFCETLSVPADLAPEDPSGVHCFHDPVSIANLPFAA